MGMHNLFKFKLVNCGSVVLDVVTQTQPFIKRVSDSNLTWPEPPNCVLSPYRWAVTGM